MVHVKAELDPGVIESKRQVGNLRRGGDTPFLICYFIVRGTSYSLSSGVCILYFKFYSSISG